MPINLNFNFRPHFYTKLADIAHFYTKNECKSITITLTITHNKFSFSLNTVNTVQYHSIKMTWSTHSQLLTGSNRCTCIPFKNMIGNTALTEIMHGKCMDQAEDAWQMHARRT